MGEHTGRSLSASRAEGSRRCAYCGAKAPLVWVHGHGQCARCGTNVEECCRGEQSRRQRRRAK